MVKGKSFYENEEPSIAAAVFEKVIEMFHWYSQPDENLQEACNWRDKCIRLMVSLIKNIIYNKCVITKES
jgi:hypothetical protein